MGGRRRTWERDDRFLLQLDSGRGRLQAAGDHLGGGAQVRRQVARLGDDADHVCCGWDFVGLVFFCELSVVPLTTMGVGDRWHRLLYIHTALTHTHSDALNNTTSELCDSSDGDSWTVTRNEPKQT